jgi:peptidylprolyl isomerase domain and WD repeat-containing protein 1
LAVENFVGHARSGSFEGVIFYRGIPKVMIQTGDPLGDGTGGESIWGKEFEDEFSYDLKHDRPYTLSIANAGPGTNGSQFPSRRRPRRGWIGSIRFSGGGIAGLETIHAIGNAKMNKTDKPFEDVEIVNIDVR